MSVNLRDRKTLVGAVVLLILAMSIYPIKGCITRNQIAEKKEVNPPITSPVPPSPPLQSGNTSDLPPAPSSAPGLEKMAHAIDNLASEIKNLVLQKIPQIEETPAPVQAVPPAPAIALPKAPESISLAPVAVTPTVSEILKNLGDKDGVRAREYALEVMRRNNAIQALVESYAMGDENLKKRVVFTIQKMREPARDWLYQVLSESHKWSAQTVVSAREILAYGFPELPPVVADPPKTPSPKITFRREVTQENQAFLLAKRKVELREKELRDAEAALQYFDEHPYSYTACSYSYSQRYPLYSYSNSCRTYPTHMRRSSLVANVLRKKYEFNEAEKELASMAS